MEPADRGGCVWRGCAGNRQLSLHCSSFRSLPAASRWSRKLVIPTTNYVPLPPSRSQERHRPPLTLQQRPPLDSPPLLIHGLPNPLERRNVVLIRKLLAAF